MLGLIAGKLVTNVSTGVVGTEGTHHPSVTPLKGQERPGGTPATCSFCFASAGHNVKETRCWSALLQCVLLTQVLGPQASVSRGPGTGPLYGAYGQGQGSVFVRIVHVDGTLVCLSKVSSTQACHTNCLTFLNCIFNASLHELSNIILLAKSRHGVGLNLRLL